EDAEKQSTIARKLYQLDGAIKTIEHEEMTETLNEEMAAATEVKSFKREDVLTNLKQTLDRYEEQLNPTAKKLLDSWDALKDRYSGDKMTFQVRNKKIEMDITTESLSGLKIPKVAFPKYQDWGERLMWMLKENVPGAFPFTAGVFPFKREG
ncbi:methylmalonyl-CoA mutase, partial [Pseudoalteromonas sp. 2103]|nr:methylmalonyl-CoA mutase [Pseudoalteromonas sp. 2103]